MTSPPDNPSMYCRKCQYVLDGLPESRCPECGTAFDPDDGTTWCGPPMPRAKTPIAMLVSFFSLPMFAEISYANTRAPGVENCIAFSLLGAVGVVSAIFGCSRGSMSSRIISGILLVLWGCAIVDVAR